jgi:flagellar basal-body rod modification protein FlgD
MASIGSIIGSGADTTSTNPSTSSSASSASSTSTLASESTFLQLLVAQIKNQDPTAPMDSTTFLSQLAQFSELEQTVGIRQDIEKGTYVAPAGTTPPATATTGAAVANLANTAAQDLANPALTTPALTSGF